MVLSQLRAAAELRLDGLKLLATDDGLMMVGEEELLLLAGVAQLPVGQIVGGPVLFLQ